MYYDMLMGERLACLLTMMYFFRINGGEGSVSSTYRHFRFISTVLYKASFSHTVSALKIKNRVKLAGLATSIWLFGHRSFTHQKNSLWQQAFS